MCESATAKENEVAKAISNAIARGVRCKGFMTNMLNPKAGTRAHTMYRERACDDVKDILGVSGESKGLGEASARLAGKHMFVERLVQIVWWDHVVPSLRSRTYITNGLEYLSVTVPPQT